MDASVLQAAQRVVNWHLQHTVMPSPPAQPTDRTDDEDIPGDADGQHADPDGGVATPSRA